MFRRFSTNFAIVSILLDGGMAALALLVAASIRYPLSGLEFIKDIFEPVSLPYVLYLVFPAIWVAVNLLFSVYDGRRNLRAFDEYGILSLAALLAGVAMAGILYFTFRDVSRFLFVSFVFLAFLGMVTWRAIARAAFRWKLFPTVQQRNILILGAGDIGQQVKEQILMHASLGLNLVGFLDDNPLKLTTRKDVYGSLDDVRAVIQHQAVDDVVIALPLSAHKRLNNVVSELHDMPVRVWIIPDYFSLTLHRASVEEFAGLPMLDLRAPALNEYQRLIKRAFDLGVTILTLPIVLPLMAIISILVKLDSRGPVFYTSRRVGENGRLFTMLKFRSMYMESEQSEIKPGSTFKSGNIPHKIRNDPRVTRVGCFLRRTSLDEFPQLFNVLRGEMSLVGPRPEMPDLVKNYQYWQRKRFCVPQGMTGWWQINGRSDRPMHMHTEDDLYYVQHYSLWLDLQILVKTTWVVLRGKGAF
jgi:exopolysaccharide biosynthesis polyprenyl glycosylphosphotransferase